MEIQKYLTGKFPPAAIWVASMASLLLVSGLDYATGDEFFFFFFYFAPVSLVAWFLGRARTILMVLVCGAAWLGVDELTGHKYTREYYRYWNGLICLLSFLAYGLVLERAKRSLDQQRWLNEELTRKMEESKRAAEKIQQLQAQVQTVCAWSKRIKVADKWISLEEFLQTELQLKLTHGMSPEAFAEYMKDLDQQRPHSP